MTETWIDNLKTVAPKLASGMQTDMAPLAKGQVALALSVTPEEVPETLAAPPDAAMQAKLRNAETSYLALVRAIEARTDALELEKAKLDDVANARQFRDSATRWIGGFVLFIFVATVVAAFLLIYKVTSNASQEVDPQFFNVIVALSGTILGYVAGYAQQVVGFYFGSSLGSALKGETITSTLQFLERKTKG